MNRALLSLIALCMPVAASADEGMWTLDNFPGAEVNEKYEVQITDDWLETVRRAVPRTDSGCSASFVSPNGLVLTNHHCALACIAQNSSAASDLQANGFLTASPDDEVSCPTDRLSVLIETEEITDQVASATSGKLGRYQRHIGRRH